jgi:hypothetical protein
VFVHALSGAASFAACLRLFRSYPLAVSPWSADGRHRSIVLRYSGADEDRAPGKNGFFILSQDRAERFVLRPWGCEEAADPDGSGQPEEPGQTGGEGRAGQASSSGEFTAQEIRPVDPVPALVHRVIAEGMPVPRDGALLGWVSDRQAMVLLSVCHGKPGSPLPGGPQIRVLPLVGSEPLRWPEFTVSPLEDGRLWEYLDRGELVDLAPVIMTAPDHGFWVPSQNQRRASHAHGCVVMKRSVPTTEFWLPAGVYMDHWMLREGVPAPPASHLLGLPGAIDLACRVSLTEGA